MTGRGGIGAGDESTARLADLVRPLTDEVWRSDLVDVLAERWRRRIVTIEAPAGFGKSTAISQSVRDNLTDPSGIDIYLRLRPRHSSEAEFSEATLRALGGSDEPGGAFIDAVVSTMTAHSPAPVCLIFDDVHELAEGSRPIDLLRELLRDLPQNGHLLLSGRTLPRLHLARFRAADEITEVGRRDLVFSDLELEQLGDAHGRSGQSLHHSGGWPAMARLTAALGASAAREYVLDEVLDTLTTQERQALYLALLGQGISDDALASCGVACTATALASRVPLVAIGVDGQAVPHDLWGRLDTALVPPADADRLGAALVAWLRGRQQPHAAAELAIVLERWDLARDAMMASALTGDAGLSVETCTRWIEAIPTGSREHAEVWYLEGLRARLALGPGAGHDRVIEAMDAFRAENKPAYEAAAALEIGTRAWLQGDLARLADVLERAPRLERAGVAWMRGIRQLGESVMHELGGDFRASLDADLAIDVDELPSELADLCLRHSSTMAALVGQSGLAVERAEKALTIRPSVRSRIIVAFTRFGHGDPSAALAEHAAVTPTTIGNLRDDFLLRMMTSMVNASLGRPIDVEGLAQLAWERTRERAFVALASAANAINDGDEDAAVTVLSEALEVARWEDPLVRGELMRFVPYTYLLQPERRPEIDASDLGPTLNRRRHLAQSLCASRSGHRVTWELLDPPAEVLCSLPLAWSAECAARATFDGSRAGSELAHYLLAALGPTARDEFRRLAERNDRSGLGARAVLAAEPALPTTIMRLRLSGRFEITPNVDADASRRRRARQLVALLSVRDRWSRDQLVELLWPDLAFLKARNNLAQTVGYVRRLLDGGRRRGEASFHVRDQGDFLELHRSSWLDVDLWRMQELLDDEAAHASAGRSAAARDALGRAVDSWSGEICAELADFRNAVPEIAAFERAWIDAATRLTQRAAADGDRARALDVSERILLVDPFHERARALRVAVHLDAGDSANAALEDVRLREALQELGATPSTYTSMLHRRLASINQHRATTS